MVRGNGCWGRGALMVFVLFFLAAGVPLPAQDPSDIQDFLQKGQACYKLKDLQGALQEFENVLLLEPGHFEAKVWLAQVYIDLKQLHKAKMILAEARKQAPGHPRVVELSTLVGPDKPVVTQKETDLVTFEALTLLGSGTRLRPYGLVIPETRVTKSPVEKVVDAFTEEEFKNLDDTPSELEAFRQDEGPLAKVFEVWSSDGLRAGLDLYFQIVMKDRGLGSQDDRKLTQKGYDFFHPRFLDKPDDPENRFYLGMIQFLNGNVTEAAKTLEPLREGTNPFHERLGEVFVALDEQKRLEEERLAQVKKQQEEEEAAKQAAAAQAQAASVAASLNSTSASGISAVEAMHNEGYELYKKGQLDPAIEKFQAAIKEKPDEPKFFYHLGLALTDKGLAGSTETFDRAIEAFNRVISVEPGSKMAKDSEIMIRDIVAAKKSLKP